MSRIVMAALAFICGFSLMTAVMTLAKADAPTGDVTSPAPDWKIRVTVTEPDSGKVVDQLVMINPDQTPRLWPTKEACVAYQDSDEFKATIPLLHDFIVKQGWDKDEVKVECVPQPHAESF